MLPTGLAEKTECQSFKVFFKIPGSLGFEHIVLYVVSQKSKKEIWRFYNYVTTVS